MKLELTDEEICEIAVLLPAVAWIRQIQAEGPSARDQTELMGELFTGFKQKRALAQVRAVMRLGGKIQEYIKANGLEEMSQSIFGPME